MIEVPMTVAESCSNQRVRQLRDFAVKEFEAVKRRGEDELTSFYIPRADIDDVLIEDLRSTADSIGHEGLKKALTTLQLLRAGKMRSIPNHLAIAESLLTYLERDFLDGWVYRRSDMGFLQALRIEGIQREAYGPGFVLIGTSLELSGKETSFVVGPFRTRGLPATMMANINLLPETAELKAEYLKQAEHLLEVAGNPPGHQCIAEGQWAADVNERTLTEILTTGKNQLAFWDASKLESVSQRKVVVESKLNGSVIDSIRAQLAGEVLASRVGVDSEASNPIPISPLIRVFDLSGERERVIASTGLTSYQYRQDIREQLVLPESHSRVLDVLTSATSSSLADVIHGKGAGNLVLCKGIPGVGKTLTAEIVAETLKRPIYTVDASSILGARSVREAMMAAFDRVRRWDGVLLLDEADVVIGARSNDLERNRVTAELLRALESFERLAFLTTNRPDDVDDAILSRCVAIIEYKAPTGFAAQRAWRILGEQLETGFVSEELAGEASEHFEAMAPRDIRQLLRLSYQISKADGVPLSLDLLKECAVFRAWEPAN